MERFRDDQVRDRLEQGCARLMSLEAELLRSRQQAGDAPAGSADPARLLDEVRALRRDLAELRKRSDAVSKSWRTSGFVLPPGVMIAETDSDPELDPPPRRRRITGSRPERQ